MKKFLFISFILVVFVATLSGCNKGNNGGKEVKVYGMESFSEVTEDSLVTYTDKKVTQQFKKAVSSAKKQSGIVDMEDPQYKVELGGESFFLWLNEEHGTIMDVEDTNSIHSLTDESVENINDMLRLQEN